MEVNWDKIIDYLIGMFILGIVVKAIGTEAFSSIFEGFNSLANLTDASGVPYTGVALFSIIPILAVVSAFKYFKD